MVRSTEYFKINPIILYVKMNKTLKFKICELLIKEHVFQIVKM